MNKGKRKYGGWKGERREKEEEEEEEEEGENKRRILKKGALGETRGKTPKLHRKWHFRVSKEQAKNKHKQHKNKINKPKQQIARVR